MSITREIAVNGMVNKTTLAVPMHQICEMNIIKEFNEIKLVSYLESKLSLS